MTLEDWFFEHPLVLIILIVGGIILVVVPPLMYLSTLENYNTIPYWDKYCHLNMTKTWDNAWQINFISLKWCNYNNVEFHK